MASSGIILYDGHGSENTATIYHASNRENKGASLALHAPPVLSTLAINQDEPERRPPLTWT